MICYLSSIEQETEAPWKTARKKNAYFELKIKTKFIGTHHDMGSIASHGDNIDLKWF